MPYFMRRRMALTRRIDAVLGALALRDCGSSCGHVTFRRELAQRRTPMRK